MNTSKAHQQMVLWLFIALLVGLLIGFGAGRQTAGDGGVMMSDQVAATSTASTTSAGTHLLGQSSAAAPAGVVAEGNSVSIMGQTAGKSVMVKSAMLSQEGWVAIRDSSGITLGAALFSAGSHANVSVSLLKPTTSGQTYQALIYFDDGTKTFNLKTETIVLNADGSVAGTTFVAQ